MAENVNEDITVSLEPVEPDPQLQIPEELPLLPLRDIVIYPYMIVPLFVSREKSIRAVDQALGEHRMILLACQKDLDKEEPKQDDLYKVGTVAVIMRMLKLPDGRIRILVQGVSRAQVKSVDTGNDFLRASLLVSVLLPTEWSSLLAECKRVLRPGGVLWLIETEWPLTNSAALRHLGRIVKEAVRRIG